MEHPREERVAKPEATPGRAPARAIADIARILRRRRRAALERERARGDSG